MTSSAVISDLRALLAAASRRQEAAPRHGWRVPTAHVSLPGAAVSEAVAERAGCGSVSLVASFLRQALEQRQFVGVIDAGDSLDPTSLEDRLLSSLFLVRAAGLSSSLRCADLLVRDGNLQLVVLDLSLSDPREVRRISLPVWYRLQRAAKQSGVSVLVLTPAPVVACAAVRLELTGWHVADDLDRPARDLEDSLPARVLRHRHRSDSTISEAA